MCIHTGAESGLESSTAAAGRRQVKGGFSSRQLFGTEPENLGEHVSL